MNSMMNQPKDDLLVTSTLGENLQPSYALAWFVLPLYALAFVLNYLQSGYVLNPDPFCYELQGKLLLKGWSMYDEVPLDKPFLTPLIYAIPQLVVPHKYWIFKVSLALVNCVQAFLVLLILKPPKSTAILTASLLLFLPLSREDWQWLSTEHISNTFIFGVLFLCWRVSESNSCTLKISFGVGLFLGAAFLIRQTTAACALIPLVSILMLPINIRSRWKFLAFVFLGGACTLLLSVGFVAICGNVERYLYSMFLHPFTYVKTSLSVSPYQYLTLISTNQLWLLLVVAIVFSSYSRNRIFLLTVLAVGLMIVFTSPRAYEHYAVNLFPFLAFAIAVSMRGSISTAKFSRTAHPIKIVYLNFALLVFLFPNWAWQIRKVIIEGFEGDECHNIADMESVASWADKTFPDAKTLWVVARRHQEHIMYASTKSPSHAVGPPWVIDEPSCLALIGGAEKVIREYVESPPDLILVDEYYADWVTTAINSNGPPTLPYKFSVFNIHVSRDVFREVIVNHRYKVWQDIHVPEKNRRNGIYLALLLDKSH